MTRIRTLLAAAAAAAVAAVATAPAALAPAAVASPAEPAATSRAGTDAQARAAHTSVVRRTPAPGARASNVKAVGIVFSQRLLTGRLDVYRGARKLSPRRSGPDGARVRATFKRRLARGAYTVRWRVVAADGHAQSGSWRFRVR